MEQEKMNKRLVLVVGGMLFDEHCVMVRRTTPEDRLSVLCEGEVSEVARTGELPAAWSRFGELYHSLYTDILTGFIAADSVELQFKTGEWRPGKKPAANTPANWLPFLCWLKDPAAVTTGS